MARETWATRVGFILAAVGSAVGLGNIWRFPWVTAENGGSAFLVVYLLVVAAVGIPGLLGAFVIGRRSKRNPAGALKELSGSRGWWGVGAGTVVTAVVLISFYSVVGGWVLRYTLESLVALFTGPAAYVGSPGAHFQSVAFGTEALLFHLLFLGVTALIVVGGVRGGLELSTKAMVPGIVVVLLGLAGWAATQEGAAAGYSFYLRFDLAVLREQFFAIVGPAAGQALFTLSLGAGTMVTYASYLSEDRSLPADATAIAVCNTFVGVLAGLVVFPILFSLGIPPGETGTGPGALFVGLAGAFSQLPAGEFVALAFFGVVLLAALSSSISILEIPVAFLVDEFDVPRRRAVALMFVLVAVLGSTTALDPELFGFVAGTLVSVLLSAGLAAYLLFVGWALGPDATEEFSRGAGALARRVATPWRFLVGVAIPVFLVFTILTTAGLNAFVGFWGTVAGALAVAIAVGATAARVRGRVVPE